MRKDRKGGKRLVSTPAPRRKNRIFSACVLFLMVTLALATAVLAANGQARDSSYTLIIKKQFASDLSSEARAEAAKQKYTFKITGQVKDNTTPVEETVTITGEDTATVSFGNAFKVSVIEQTTEGDFKVGNVDWNVVKTDCVSEMHVSASRAEVSISRDGGYIDVTRPADVPDVTFQLTKKESGEKVGSPVTVAAGETKRLGEGLSNGEYVITKLRAADGFNVLVGDRNFVVPAKGTGEFHINGTDSEVVITAPTLEATGGRVLTHHYRLSGPKSVEFDVQSGATYTLAHLTEGDYTIEVSETYDGIKGYTVTVPETTTKNRSTKWYNAISTTSTVKRSYGTVGGDYIDNLTYGPLYDKNGKVLSNATYKFNYGALNPDKPGYLTTWTMKNAVKGSSIGNPVSLTGNDVVRKPLEKKLYVGTKEVSDPAAVSFKVSWVEYTKEINPYTAEEAGTWYKVPVDDRGYLIIEKPADSNPRSDDVKYYYTITDSNSQNITGFTITATDKDGNEITVPTGEEGSTVTLKAGQSVKISGLKGGGTYRIQETIKEADPMGFKVELVDTTKSVTTPGASIEIKTMDARTVEISRSGNPADDNNRVYTYKITKDGDSEFVPRIITLKAGETKTVAEVTGSKLPAGKYTITATDDQIAGFDVAYSDSSSLTSDYIRTATVTFTNHFDKVEASYHVIHEYYLDNKDGTYTFEGASSVFTKNCDGKSHDDKQGHYAKDVHQLESHGGHTYTYLGDINSAYGKVVSWDKGDTAKDVELESDDEVYSGPFDNDWTGSNEQGTRDYAYKPLTNLDCAMATRHDSATGSHDEGAQIIILRYSREETKEERGTYNVIHVYYQRTSGGYVWEGNSSLETVDIGRLTDENRYKTYDADGVEKILRFTPEDKEYPYTYDGAAYGRIVKSDNENDYPGTGTSGEGWEYRKDDTMTSVKATPEGDQIIVLRYYRSGGYKVVHEYYYQEKAEQSEGSGGEAGGDPDGEGEDESTPEGQGGAPQSRAGEDGGFNGTLTDSDGFTYDFEGKSGISSYSDALESRHDASEVQKVESFRPAGDEQHKYTFKDAVYGYVEDGGTYRLAPYKDGVTATADDDEIIILRYVRGDGVPDKPNPPDRPDPPGGGSDPDDPKPPKDPDKPPKDPDKPPVDPENPPDKPPVDPENPEDPDKPPVDPEKPEDPDKPPVDPEHPTELPDPNDPNSPDEITIWEDGVPKTYVKVWDPEKEEWIYIPEEDVPLWDKVPQTGDESRSGLWAALAAGSLCGFAALTLAPKKRKSK